MPSGDLQHSDVHNSPPMSARYHNKYALPISHFEHLPLSGVKTPSYRTNFFSFARARLIRHETCWSGESRITVPITVNLNALNVIKKI